MIALPPPAPPSLVCPLTLLNSHRLSCTVKECELFFLFQLPFSTGPRILRLANRPFPSFLAPLLQREGECTTWKWVLFACESKLIFVWRTVHQDSLWKRGARQLGNGLLHGTLRRQASFPFNTVEYTIVHVVECNMLNAFFHLVERCWSNIFFWMHHCENLLFVWFHFLSSYMWFIILSLSSHLITLRDGVFELTLLAAPKIWGLGCSVGLSITLAAWRSRVQIPSRASKCFQA